MKITLKKEANLTFIAGEILMSIGVVVLTATDENSLTFTESVVLQTILFIFLKQM